MSRGLVFGATGFIGRAVAAAFAAEGVDTLRVSRRGGDVESGPALAFDPLAADADWEALAGDPFDRVVFAQGANRNDSVFRFDRAAYLGLMDANVTYVAVAMAELVGRGLLAAPARLVVIGSIWQTLARQEKLSYAISKAALQGLVHSASLDLARDGHLINAVLPGVLDTAMTRAMLTGEQLARFEGATPFGRLASVADVAEMVNFLCSNRNGSITGQFVAVDLGYRHARLV